MNARSRIIFSVRSSVVEEARALKMLRQAHLQVRSRLEELAQVQQGFKAFYQATESEPFWQGNRFDQLNLALTEGFTNAVRHAHAALPQTTPVEISLALWAERMEICIWDRGEPFDPSKVQEPPQGALRESGYGWFLLRRLADQVTYHSLAEGRNCLKIVKYSKNL
ncbi:ATP-binding protein [Vasconcelosia minhoensis]|nr:anti-sigma regulatory factor [Romeria gracilis]